LTTHLLNFPDIEILRKGDFTPCAGCAGMVKFIILNRTPQTDLYQGRLAALTGFQGIFKIWQAQSNLNLVAVQGVKMETARYVP